MGHKMNKSNRHPDYSKHPLLPANIVGGYDSKPWPHCGPGTRSEVAWFAFRVSWTCQSPAPMTVVLSLMKLCLCSINSLKKNPVTGPTPGEQPSTRISILFAEKDLDWYREHGCELVKVCAEPGDLIIWTVRCTGHSLESRMYFELLSMRHILQLHGCRKRKGNWRRNCLRIGKQLLTGHIPICTLMATPHFLWMERRSLIHWSDKSLLRSQSALTNCWSWLEWSLTDRWLLLVFTSLS